MAGQKKTKQSTQGQIDPNAWMVTFADLIMLLLTFFVLLLTMKSMDTKEIEKKFKFFTSEGGPLEFAEIRISGEATDHLGTTQKTIFFENTEVLEQAFDLMEGITTHSVRNLKIEDLKNTLKITEGQRGVVITINSDELFDTGKAEIKTDQLFILDAAGSLLKNASNEILIMGHTDSIPYRSDIFSSNQELSFFRALSVFFYLTDNSGLNPGQLASGGYGDLMPRYSNDTPENRAKNRRIELILRKVKYDH